MSEAETGNCLFCGIKIKSTETSISHKKRRKYCSISCAAKNHIGDLVIRNKSRRKYTQIPGLSRTSVAYRNNKGLRDRVLLKDSKKREDLIVLLGGRCVKCGYDLDIRALALDHTNSDGKEDRIRVGSKIQRYYINRIEEAKARLQILCCNCNHIKSIECNEHNKSRRIKET